MLFNFFVIALILFNIICLYSFFIEPYAFEVTYNECSLPADKSDYHGITIVHLTDLHLDTIGRYEKKIRKQLCEINPDLLFITGDHIICKQDFKPAIEFINSLKAKQGTYIVFGNSDYSNMESYFRTIKNTPLQPDVILLRNDIVDTTHNNARIIIAGLDDPVTGHAHYNMLSRIPQDNTFKILLSHAYTANIAPYKNKFDLILAGHTHGGQVNVLPKKLIAKWRQKSDKIALPFMEGFHDLGNTYLNVSRGIGMSLLPIRFRSRPEVSVIRLVGKHFVKNASPSS